jgi:feruloyl esterase
VLDYTEEIELSALYELKTWLLPVVLVAAGHAIPAAADDDIAARCTAFAGPAYVGNYKYSTLPDAPTYLTAAALVPAANGLPQFCEINGYIAPQIVFKLRLPASGWNGKLLVTGCEEGYCGSIAIDSPASQQGLKRGYAVTTSDSGHIGTPFDAQWAYNNPQAKLDFAYRAPHVNKIAAKAIVADFYGNAPSRSYFQGCSTGGRQGMVAAQRLPKDFDGIIVGAPAMLSPSTPFATLWSGVSNMDGAGKQILDRSAAAILNRAAVAACDAADGLKDGQIGDARQCKFDPAALTCKAGQRSDCLSAAQVEAARKIYGGPVDSRGRAIHVSGLPIGSELGWADRIIGADGGQGTNVTAMIDWFRFMAHPIDAGPLWQLAQLDWDNDPNRTGGMAAVYGASSPDLRDFATHGGKMIHYQGWQDPAVAPLESIDYYETATRAVGGLARIQSFYRLFMIPGLQHCTGGPGATEIDPLTHLEQWVENGKPPEVLMGKGIAADGKAFTRAHFPYPDSARYKSGNPNDAASFQRVAGDRSFETRPLR